jgi:hypothetical protein
MLQAVQFPTLVTSLNTGLAEMNRDAFYRNSASQCIHLSLGHCYWRALTLVRRTTHGLLFKIVLLFLVVTINADDLDATPVWRSLATREDQMVELCGGGVMKKLVTQSASP